MTKDELIQLGITYIETTGKYPVSKKWTIKTGGCSHDRMYETFGNWPNYIAELSKHIDIPDSGNNRITYTKEQLINYIHDFVAETGEIPNVRNFISNSEYPSDYFYRIKFGSWNKAIEAAGYTISNRTPNKPLENAYTKENLLNYIHKFVFETNKIPITKDFIDNNKYPSYVTYQKYFGSWNKAIEAAGYSPNIQNGFGINTKGLDGHLYRSRAEAYFCDNYLFNKVEYEIEPKYPEPYNKWYDWYLPESDTYIELDGGLRPKTITEKIKINKQLNRKLLIITTKDIYKNKFSFEPL